MAARPRRQPRSWCGVLATAAAPDQLRSSPRTPVDAPPRRALADQLKRRPSLKCPSSAASGCGRRGAPVDRTAAARHKSILGFMYTPSIERPLTFGRGRDLKAIKNDFMNRYYAHRPAQLAPLPPALLLRQPGPDMPVRSPEVFASALKGLFDRRSSSLELLEEPRLVGTISWRVAACWAIRAAWKPSIKPFVGRTRSRWTTTG